MANYLDSDIKFLVGVGEKRAATLKKELDIVTMRDLLYYFPFRYIDRTKIFKISEIKDDSFSYVQLRVRIKGFSHIGVGPKRRFCVEVEDSSGAAELVWFKGIDWIEKRLDQGREYIVFGRPTIYNNTLSIVHPEIESVEKIFNRPNAGVEGVYGTTERLTSIQLGSKGIYALVCALWGLAEDKIEETLPDSLIRQHSLMGLKEALFNIHFPQNGQKLKAAEYRLKFEELFGIQLGIVSDLAQRVQRNDGFIFSKVGDSFNSFYRDRLPFSLTNAQKRVVKEIRQDTVSSHQMNRLLQGDVGSGKTMVALMSMLLAKDNGYQSTLMAPTEILSRQHFATINKMVEGLDVSVEIVTGTTKKRDKKEILERLKNGQIDILIGTHALIEDSVEFSNLGFVVIDEQHRFGVEQRAKLWTKNNKPPHILVMTATPIPRTLAMTLYGDLDVSVIDELPPGRKPIRTSHHYESHRLKIYGFIRDEIAKGRQVYVVYPLIKESEKMDYQNLYDGFETMIREFPLPKYNVVPLHGKMKADDKDASMKMFKDGVAQILVATSVIEVGVDVPNASIMIIESAERFGLSQLHQLRGRVGRGAEQSYCLLVSRNKLSKEGRARLNAMVSTNDGFELSELDLKLRGAGDMTGTQQSGMIIDLKIANIARDSQIVELARRVAMSVLESDPLLSQQQNRLLKTLKERFTIKKRDDFSMIS